MFDRALPTFRDSDEAAAKKLIDDHLWIMQSSDEFLDRLVKDAEPGQAPNDAVSTALYTRYLKQIAVHLINVTSSVVNPFDSLGFISEGGESYVP